MKASRGQTVIVNYISAASSTYFSKLGLAISISWPVILLHNGKQPDCRSLQVFYLKIRYILVLGRIQTGPNTSHNTIF